MRKSRPRGYPGREEALRIVRDLVRHRRDRAQKALANLRVELHHLVGDLLCGLRRLRRLGVIDVVLEHVEGELRRQARVLQNVRTSQGSVDGTVARKKSSVRE